MRSHIRGCHPHSSSFELGQTVSNRIKSQQHSMKQPIVKDMSPDGQHQGTSAIPKPRLSRNAEDNKYMPIDARTWAEGFRMLLPWILILLMSIVTGALVSFYLVGSGVCYTLPAAVIGPYCVLTRKKCIGPFAVTLWGMTKIVRWTLPAIHTSQHRPHSQSQ